MMVLTLEAQKQTNDAGEGSSSSKYRIFGNLWLDDPREHLSKQALDRLRDLEPHFRMLETRTRPCKSIQYPGSNTHSSSQSTFRLDIVGF
jgi:hypothetical protein